MIRSSNPFWKDKRNVRLNYTVTGTQFTNCAYYQAMNSDTVKTMEGTDTPADAASEIYTWRGKGFLRLTSAKWEILIFQARNGGADWVLMFAHKNVFTAPAVNLMCRQKNRISENNIKEIERWFATVDSKDFQSTVKSIADIKQE